MQDINLKSSKGKTTHQVFFSFLSFLPVSTSGVYSALLLMLVLLRTTVKKKTLLRATAHPRFAWNWELYCSVNCLHMCKKGALAKS